MIQDVNDLALAIVAALQGRAPFLDLGGLAPDLAKALRNEGARDDLASARRAAFVARVAGCSWTGRYLARPDATPELCGDDGTDAGAACRNWPTAQRRRATRRGRPDRR